MPAPPSNLPYGLTTIGWREWVSLPGWNVPRLLAKTDTGARTSAIDVDELEILPDNRVRFRLVMNRRRTQFAEAEAAIVRRTTVRSSLGDRSPRVLVRTIMKLGHVEREIEVSLVRRQKMLCRMLLGRSALAGAFMVDASRRHLLDRPKPQPKPRRKAT